MADRISSVVDQHVCGFPCFGVLLLHVCRPTLQAFCTGVAAALAAQEHEDKEPFLSVKVGLVASTCNGTSR